MLGHVCELLRFLQGLFGIAGDFYAYLSSWPQRMTHGVVEVLRCSQKHLPQPGSDKDSVVSSDCFLSPLHGMFSELLTRPLLARCR